MRHFGKIAPIALASILVLAAPSFAAADCVADLTGDGQVGPPDLKVVLDGQQVYDPLADFNGDGSVGCFDIQYVLGNWGSCPAQPSDLNEDGVVDIEDVRVALSYYGLDCRMDLNQDTLVDSQDVAPLVCLMNSSDPTGDFDASGVVDEDDLAILLDAMGRDCRADLNKDGWVAHADVEVIEEDWGK
jgi:hypothetical protein